MRKLPATPEGSPAQRRVGRPLLQAMYVEVPGAGRGPSGEHGDRLGSDWGAESGGLRSNPVSVTYGFCDLRSVTLPHLGFISWKTRLTETTPRIL